MARGVNLDWSVVSATIIANQNYQPAQLGYPSCRGQGEDPSLRRVSEAVGRTFRAWSLQQHRSATIWLPDIEKRPTMWALFLLSQVDQRLVFKSPVETNTGGARRSDGCIMAAHSCTINCLDGKRCRDRAGFCKLVEQIVDE